MNVKPVDNFLLLDNALSFNNIKPEQFLPAVEHMIEAGDVLLENTSPTLPEVCSWDKLIEPYLYYLMRFDKILSLASHLESVLDCKVWRQEYQKALPLVSEFFTRWSHNTNLYQLFVNFKNTEYFHELPDEKKLYVENFIRDADLDGVNLPTKQKQKLQDLNTKLSKISHEFSVNILEATDAWHFDFDDDAYLEGLPANIQANIIGKAGDSKHRISLKSDIVNAVLTYSKVRELREKVYKAWVTRASSIGPHSKDFDNSNNITEILKLRHEIAKILNFPNYAHLSLANKNANSPEQVVNFLEDLGHKAKGMAEAEKVKLLEFASSKLGLDALEPWDIGFVCEAMKQEIFGYSSEQISQYFKLDNVLDGMLRFSEDLYQVRIVKSQVASKYHDDVEVYNIIDCSSQLVGVVYFDLFSRKGKKGGAWVSSYQTRAEFCGSKYHPIVFLVCNFISPSDNEPVLLEHSDVVTLFHEFGHALHCLLTNVKTFGVSGLQGVEWDLVEWPSQWMESWSWSKGILEKLSSHYLYGNNMPYEMVDCLNSMRLFQAGMQITRQVQFALTDMLIHASEKALNLKKAEAIYAEMLAQYSVWPQYPDSRFLHSFAHIFAGGYSAGYYSYLWAEAMSADSFVSLRQEFNDDYCAIGATFRDHVLEVGGMLQLDVAFNKMFGRNMDSDVLLKYLGLS